MIPISELRTGSFVKDRNGEVQIIQSPGPVITFMNDPFKRAYSEADVFPQNIDHQDACVGLGGTLSIENNMEVWRWPGRISLGIMIMPKRVRVYIGKEFFEVDSFAWHELQALYYELTREQITPIGASKRLYEHDHKMPILRKEG
jgi:hypothetical protein